MLNQLVAIESLLVVKVMSAKDAVEVFEGREWHCVLRGKWLRIFGRIGFMEFGFVLFIILKIYRRVGIEIYETTRVLLYSTE